MQESVKEGMRARLRDRHTRGHECTTTAVNETIPDRILSKLFDAGQMQQRTYRSVRLARE